MNFAARLLLPALATLSAFAAPAGAAPQAPRPNIIYILVDDMGYGDVGAFFQNQRGKDPGLPAIKTPSLDKMAEEGIQLRGHYCPAPVCAPSRASFLSGVHQGHANIRDNQFDKALEDNHTVASVLRASGYSTAIIGKWGLQGTPGGAEGGDRESEAKPGGSPATWPAYPTKRGFDSFFGYVRHADGHEHYPKEGIYRGKKQVWDGDREVSADLDKCYTTDLFTARAKKWIIERRQTDPAKPFFLYLAYDAPHAVTELPTGPYPAGGGLKGGLQWTGKAGEMINTANGTPDSWQDPDYADARYVGADLHGKKGGLRSGDVPWPEVYKRYATSVRRIDDAVGDLQQLLKDLEIDSNTLVIFTTDNGPSQESYLKQELDPSFFASFGPFDGIKRDCWEGGIRTGAIARAPGLIPARKVSETPCQAHDWMATFAALAGIPAPARTDGVSLLPTLTGTGTQVPSTVYVEYQVAGKTPNYPAFDPAHAGRQRGQMQAIRIGDMVGVRYGVKSHAEDFEIYNVLKDPGQRTNLASKSAGLQQQMKDRVLQLRRPNPSARRPYDGEGVPGVEPAKKPPASGVAWSTYHGDFPWVPDFGSLKPMAAGTAPIPAAAPVNASGATGVLVSGMLTVPADGFYTFHLPPGKAALFRLHAATVIDTAGPGKPTEGGITLKAGVHPFSLHYLHDGKPAAIPLEWSGPDITRRPIPADAFSH